VVDFVLEHAQRGPPSDIFLTSIGRATWAPAARPLQDRFLYLESAGVASGCRGR